MSTTIHNMQQLLKKKTHRQTYQQQRQTVCGVMNNSGADTRQLKKDTTEMLQISEKIL